MKKLTLNRSDNLFIVKKVFDMFLYTAIYFCYFLQHKTRTTHIASKRTVFCKVFTFFSVYFSCYPQKRYLLTCLITVLKDRLNLSLNDPICHHFKLSVRLYVSHYLGKKKWAKTSSKYSSYFIIIIQIYLLCQFWM